LLSPSRPKIEDITLLYGKFFGQVNFCRETEISSLLVRITPFSLSIYNICIIMKKVNSRVKTNTTFSELSREEYYERIRKQCKAKYGKFTIDKFNYYPCDERHCDSLQFEYCYHYYTRILPENREKYQKSYRKRVDKKIAREIERQKLIALKKLIFYCHNFARFILHCFSIDEERHFKIQKCKNNIILSLLLFFDEIESILPQIEEDNSDLWWQQLKELNARCDHWQQVNDHIETCEERLQSWERVHYTILQQNLWL